jgi:transcriptional regulator with GAF, ATPase, and Fis domain
VGVGGADGRTGRIGQDHTRDVLLDLTLEQLERLQITHALETTDHRVFGPGGAAEKLDINPSTLLSRMDKLGIPRPRAARASRRTPAG